VVNDDEANGSKDASHQKLVSIRVEVDPIAEKRSLPWGSFKKKVSRTEVDSRVNASQALQIIIHILEERPEKVKPLGAGHQSKNEELSSRVELKPFSHTLNKVRDHAYLFARSCDAAKVVVA
jgi:hypothetical protein